MKKLLLLSSFIFFAINFICQGQIEKTNHNNTTLFHIEGDGGWDYLALDENTERLFISHSSVTQVIDSKTGKLVGTIQDTKGVHGIAIDQEDNKAFISCGKDSSVSVVNLSTLALLAKVKVTGANPDAILYDKFSGNVFVFNGRSSNATVINTKNNSVVTTIPLAGKPEFAVSDGNGIVYVNIEDKSLITVIDSKKLTIEKTWSIAPGEEPSGLALDPNTHRLFSVCSNKKMVILNSDNGNIITTLDIGDRTDGCAFDPELKNIYSSNGDGTLTVVKEVNADEFYVSTTLQTAKGARTICIDKKTHHIYLPTAEYGPAPVATAENPHPRPSIIPGSFVILDISP